jgi:hypothetical protein
MTPRTVGAIVHSALLLYGAYPWLFLVLAVAVVAPYELIVLAVTGTSPLAAQGTTVSTALTLTLIEFALIGPLVSAFYVRAVSAVAEGARPVLREVVWEGLQVLPVVTAAQIVAGLGIGLGLLAFLIPGIVLAVRWAVVAQAAAIERTDWLGALRRSGELTRGHYLHVFGVFIVTGLLTYAVLRTGDAIAGSRNGAGQVALGIGLATITRSFTALTTAVLYFELRARAMPGRWPKSETRAPGDDDEPR